MEDQNYYKLRLSPEDFRGEIVTETWSGDSFGVYTGMSYILSGGTGGSSILTGLTIPIVLNQTCIDIGYYSVTDGDILQKEVMNNFIFSASTGSPYTFYFTNTSDLRTKKYLEQTDFILDWGDGTFPVIIGSGGLISHNYPPGNFTITLTADSPWGKTITQKNIQVPFTIPPITNPEGNLVFPVSEGNWTATPTSYNFIYSGDADCDAQTIRPAGTTPITITGYTKSNLYDMKSYGGGFRTIGQVFTGSTGIVGQYIGQGPNNEQAYIINDILYIDFEDGTTIFSVQSSGLTLLDCQIITKDETLMNIIEQPQVYSNVFIERGKNSVLEYMNRVGEVDNIGDMQKYGYGFFNIKE
jgi:hypothetical protein